MAGTQFKMNFVYPLPWNIQVAGNYQNLPGIPILATRTFTNAQIAPSLGRNLSACPAATGACTATVSLPIYAPYSLFEPRFTQLVVRLAKIFKIGRTRLEGDFDIYNLFNSAEVLSASAVYGPAFMRPSQILAAR